MAQLPFTVTAQAQEEEQPQASVPFVWTDEPVPQGHQYTPPDTLEQSLADIEEIKKAPAPGFLELIRVLPQEQQNLIIEWYPRCYLRPSPYLDGRIVGTPEAILMHAQGALKDAAKQRRAADKEAADERRAKRAQREANKEANAEKWKQYQEQCRQRKAWIAELNTEWRKRIIARDAAIKEWNAYVEAARAAYQSAKNSDLPPHPETD